MTRFFAPPCMDVSCELGIADIITILRNIVLVTMSFVNCLIVFSLVVFSLFFIVFSFLLSFYDE